MRYVPSWTSVSAASSIPDDATTQRGDEPHSLPRVAIAAAALGNATEWFDYGIYAYGLAYISAALFPGNTASATLFALGTFAISFLIRPLGGLFWGPLGDRLGRKRVLALTVLTMSGATLLVGVLPSYATAGWLAPAALIVLRMVQGFSTGGEYGGAATFIAEYAPDSRRGLCGSFLEFATLAGFSLGAFLMLGFALLLGDSAMHAWGWRLPFLVAAPLGLIGFYLRSRLEETPVFRELEEQAHRREKSATAALPIRLLLVRYAKPLLLLGGLVVALNVVNYVLLAYMPTYMHKELGVSENMSLLIPLIGMLAMMVLLPFAGWLSDRVGRKTMWWFSLVGLFVAAVPMFTLMTHGPLGAFIGFAVLGVLYVPQLATISAMFPAMFPTHVRYAGMAIAYNVSTSLFGGTAPIVNDWLIGKTGNALIPAYYMMAACAVGLIALLAVIETRGCSLRGEAVPGQPG
ncbi:MULTISPECIES: MFS transporter [Burkholderia cepacia complex]|uniref:MFS transporter n=1 Tax=Burkholderia cenocepacia TaxID=95486 RepID=A0AAW4TRN0_9BURK|nr:MULTISPECIES: MFS transporter [Burkholderia cepacia complex]AQQ31702.1 MFS transporter [Burkholderia cenocepacia]KOR23285.1 amino acid transporter [Burkholderia cenocepacia]MBR7979453.1 MFS transporter [Burkholderia cenocepacia]MBR8079895.1 MFS transporter [Burkholderia cenocepacia]MBR8093645.1 MFS transporter [Burkholderia cenocepacia]